jgi:2-dehydropantoate 2-reductase
VRFVVFGAGAIGGVVGGRLHQHGHTVTLVARGDHLEAIRARGLRIEDPDGATAVDVAAIGSVAAYDWGDDDVVLLAVKGQHTPTALDELRASAPASVPVFCLQNGVDNERQVLRIFADVYGVCVMCPATFLEPGIVQADSSPVTGLLDLGRYPDGLDDRARAVSGALSMASFESRPVPDVMRWKYAKLVMNLRNAIGVVCPPDSGAELARRARQEAVACFEAAGTSFTSRDEDLARRGDRLQIRPVAGRPRSGSSSWQSVARGTGSVETDLLNGEVVLLGRLHGVPTPVNAALQRLAHEVARGRLEPASVPEPVILADLAGGAVPP